MTRPAKISAGKIWHVYLDDSPDVILFEGNLTACRKLIKETFGWRFYKKGTIRLGQVIWEPEDSQ